MPGSLDSCINSVYEDGNIPASSGTPPVRVLLREPLDVEVVETASAVAVQSIAAPATSAVSAMLAGPVFVNAGTSREAYVDGVMVNL